MGVLFWFAVISAVCAIGGGQEAQFRQASDAVHPELPKLVRNWAEKLGGELWHFGEMVTRRNSVIESFRHTSVVQEDGATLLNEIAEKVKDMLAAKVDAVRRIIDVAENAAKDAKDVADDYDYYNAKDLINSAEPAPTTPDYMTAEEEQSAEYFVEPDKPKYISMVSDDYQMDEESVPVAKEETFEEEPEDELEEEEEDGEEEEGEDIEQEPMASLKPPVDKRRLPLYPDRNFYSMNVNINVSSVHVPSNVYDRSPEVINGIMWSEELDKTFKNNYAQDPTLSWQYFGHFTGFMRQYPAIAWDQEHVDLYDCRMRAWFIEAASSPKDIIILIDRSGSMTGMRREVAKHVVNNILDTLGNNDYVNIYTFSNTTEPLVDCFSGVLVQANLANVRVFKDAMNSFKTEQIANFSLALTMAFQLLQTYRENREGAQCNQAIMLVTDGVYYNFKEIFKEYNWQNLPFMPVRVFTYLIGREVSDVREVKWMACANQGYYVHLSTYAEVREQVLNYVPVMARPMVLSKKKPNPIWTPVYADISDPKLTNWLWVNRERTYQRDRFLRFRRDGNRSMSHLDEIDRRLRLENKKKYEVEYEIPKYRLMTSVSIPVYDKRENATRIANLLGVAGADVPIEYLERIMLPYKLGVNGYAFIVTNNGYVIMHPDLRPVFQGILKPAYNRVDLIELELLDDDSDPRIFAEELVEFRRAVVLQQTGQREFKVKFHIDEMKRIMFGKRYYFYKGISGTPFTLVVALPGKYGLNKIQHSTEDVHRIAVNNKHNLTQFFTGNWTIHPKWHYCRYLKNKHHFESVQEELLHFLHKIVSPGWKWSPECDKQLINKLVSDAKVTEWFNKNITTTSKEEKAHEFVRRFGITVAFMATHSGLTRWQDFPQNTNNKSENKKEFHEIHNKAIDEIWYKRAIEQHYKQPRSFVYSVPFDADLDDENKDFLVTASHAVFKEDKKLKYPAAVIGFQFYHQALHKQFKNITEKCGEISCKRTCQSEELYCLLVDDSGYIVVSYDRKRTGMFLGDFRPDIMELLVEDGIYNRTRIYDYQGTCFPNINTGSPARRLLNPLGNLLEIFHWAMGSLMFLLKATFAENSDDFLHFSTSSSTAEDEDMIEEDDDIPASPAFEKDFDQRLLVNKTTPEPCDTEMYLYSLTHYTETNISRSGYNKTMNCSRPYLVQPVVASNLILLVIKMICQEPQPEGYWTPHPVEIFYNESRHCYMAKNNNFTRRNYMTCMNRHPEENNITLCGGSCRPIYTHPAVFCVLFFVLLVQNLRV